MKNNKTKRILLFLLSILLLSALVLHGFADSTPGASGETTVGQTGSTGGEPTASETADEPETPTGFLGFINTLIALREGGGLVTRVFGTEIDAKFGEITGKVRDVPIALYILTILLCVIFAYVLGSVNFGIIVSKKVAGDDVRNHGSGNSGMTNVLRVYGKKAAALTFLGDAGKAAIAALVGMLLGGNGCGYIAVAACMIGHAFPMFFKFKGGKSVACVFGGMLMLEPIAALLLLAIFLLIVLMTKYVSLGSIIASALIPVFVSSFWAIGLTHNITSFDYFIVCIATVFYACFIIWLHRGNIKRLYNGEERKLELFKKNPKKNKKNEEKQ